MAFLTLEEKNIKPVALVATGFFILFAALYFSPVQIPHKIAFTVGSAFIASLWLCPWQISFALLFSALGDYFGSCNNFLGQMGFFAIGHIFYIWAFVTRWLKKVEIDKKLTTRTKGFMCMLFLMVAILLAVVFFKIVPCTPEGIIRYGVSIYAILISSMLYFALLQRSSLFALGAVLFVFSDFILAWNKFVEPVQYSKALIMIPYYAGQYLLFIRSSPYRVKAGLRGFRF